jgi:hypothetical protein
MDQRARPRRRAPVLPRPLSWALRPLVQQGGSISDRGAVGQSGEPGMRGEGGYDEPDVPAAGARSR